MPGDCHYQVGNANAKRRVARLQQLLSEIGLEPERVSMVHMSSAMGSQFAGAATEMSEVIANLGSNPLRAPKTVPEVPTRVELKVEADQ